jgi:diguanylate cyclase (GGDEF)-like protein/PAS domain S-box-containing protein
MFRVLTCLADEHDWGLVVLAGLICLLASASAISLYHRARATSARARAIWIATAGIATGCGIWATHFIAMLAYDPGVVIGYEITATVLSLVVAIAVTSLGLTVAVVEPAKLSTNAATAVGGGIVGAGVACMHYLGMSALELPGHVHWAPDLVAASIILGVLFGVAALSLAVRSDRLAETLGAAGLLTLAIVSHHFTAMGAVTIVPDPGRLISAFSLSPDMLALAVAGAAISIIGTCFAASVGDRRAEDALSEQNILHDAALNNMNQGLNMFDSSGCLVLTNQRYIDMYGLSSDIVKPGCTVRRMVEHRIERGNFFTTDPETYIANLLTMIRRRVPSRTTLELSDGRVVHVVNEPMQGGGWVVTHEDITERHRAEKDLERTRNFLSTVIENVPATIVVKETQNLKYVLINRAGEEYYGIARNDLIGRTAPEVFPETTAKVIEGHDQQLLRTRNRAFFDEHSIVTPNNKSRVITATRLPIVGDDGQAQYLVTVIQDVTERKLAEARIAHMAHHDALTGLPNRAAFNERFESALAQAARTNEPFAVMCIDLDRFKEINDVFGHAVGDDLLCALTTRLQTAAGNALLARLGGDEFALIATEKPFPASAAQLSDRLLSCVSDEFDIIGHKLRIGLSVGIALYPIDGMDATSLLGNADAALYRAKADGRGSIRFFEADMDKRLRDRRALVQDLRLAAERHQLVLHYQPQARINAEVIGFEALIRWRHPVRGLVAPAVFIPIAEESGLILPIGEWVLREACREAASWPKPLQIAINLSPIQFRHGDLASLVHSVLLETGLAPDRLELEITESVLVDDFSRAVRVLRQLKALGVRIAMDDFGTGYSSLSNLQSFAFDKIKIDRSFISNLETNRHAATIVRAVIGLGRGLDLPVVAEGVETKEQLAFLSSEACAEIQGYLLGHPMPIVEYARLVGREPNAEHERLVG